MTPSLVALSGRLQGQTIALAGDGLAIGRHPSNDLAIPDSAVSRHHCVLRQTSGAWRIVDLDSRHGTFVNNRPVHDEELRQGDVLGIGESTFLVLLDGPAGEESGAGEAEVELEAGTEIRLPAGSSIYLRPDQSSDQSSDQPGALTALLDLAASCGAPRDATALARSALERILAAIPAERAAFALAEGDEPEILAFRHRRQAGGGRPFAPSRSLSERALREGTAILYRSGSAAVSASVEGVRAAACVPLLDGGSPLGFLYADTRAPGEDLGEEHLQWLTAAGALISPALASLRRLERAEAESLRLQESVLGRGLVGESPALRRAADVLARAAPTASTVLLLGESGTGKEMAARALHAGSPRSGKPFVAINCASLSENLLESELFGHEQGAFTGAVARKTGKLEVAQGGTLFLDEIGELPPPLQAKLLRVLQERSFERVGGTRPIAVDVRLVAATNRDLKKAVAGGTFRDDLFYRLNVISVTMPPLRERREDVPLLASHFAALHGRTVRGRPVGIAPAARALLVRYDWPGNVRELSNAIERAVVLGLEEEIRPEDLPETLLESALPDAGGEGAEEDYHAALNEAKKRILRAALTASGGNVTRAAEKLGLHPNHLHRLITSLGLR